VATPSQNITAAPEAEATPSGMERLVFFSDAVFAIAITLLALEIRLPDLEEPVTNEALLHALQSLGSSYLGYVLSFLVIGGFWIGHHRRFRYIVRYDKRLLYLNLVFLMLVAFMPFPSSVISKYNNQVGTLFYAAFISVQSLMTTFIWWYASSNYRLISPTLEARFIRREIVIGLSIAAVFLLSIVVALFDDNLARLSWMFLIPVSVVIR
jgi:uncharacterized membrane protein